MAQVNTCGARISSVEDYLSQADEIYNSLFCNIAKGSRCELWYRGQVRSDFVLLPRIGRPPLHCELEVVYLSKFKSMAIPFVQMLPAFPLPGGDPPYWSWLVIMQHYGVPTRLMDWTRYALAALYFATNPADPARTSGSDGAVWILNPVILNQAFDFNPGLKPGYIPNMEEAEFTSQFGRESPPHADGKPAAAIGPLNSTNIVAQRGVFTVFPHQKKLTALEKLPDSSDYLFKICVASESFDRIQTQLMHYGVTNLALFPDLGNIAGEITLQVLNEGVIAAVTRK